MSRPLRTLPFLLATCAVLLPAPRSAAQEAEAERAEAAAADEPQPLLRREGDFVVDRPARLVDLADGALAAVFEPPAASVDADDAAAPGGVSDDGFLAGPPPPEPVPTLPPMVLQPSRTLNALRAVWASGSPDARFSLSGRVQQYRGRNHLLLSGFAGLRPAPAPAAPAEPLDPVVPRDDPATTGVEALMAEMNAEGRPETDRSTDLRPPAPATAPTGGTSAGWRDGELVSRRLGRVVPGGDAGSGAGASGGSTFVFDAGDPPLRLLPSATTERAESLVDGEGRDPLFELSGRVYASGEEAWVLPAALRWTPGAGRVDEPAYTE